MARRRVAPGPGDDPAANEEAAATGRQQQPQQQQQHSQQQQQEKQQLFAGVDESAPLVFAVGRMGPAYWDWVERPVAGRPRFFARDFFENCSKTVWWVVPLIWLPVCAAAAVAALLELAGGAAGSATAWQAAEQQHHHQQQQGWHALASAWRAPAPPPAALLAALPRLAGLQLAGALLWQALEYCIHRFAFHARGDSYWAITIHFLFHGCHHKYPLDAERLVFPPVPAAAIASVIYAAIRAALPRAPARGLMSGVLLGYVAYDCIHYALHHGGKLPGSYLRGLRLRHSHHHYQDGGRGYQISSTLFDVVLGTGMRAGAPAARRGGGEGGGGGKGGGGDAADE